MTPPSGQGSWLDGILRFCLSNKLIVILGILLTAFWGTLVAPFDWDLGPLPRDPVPVDAIPDIGENQQIVFTSWPGRSPQDIEDQISYPLTTALLGIPEVRTVRTYSYFGFSTIYVIFNESAEFYWSRSRVLEKLSSLPSGTLPDDVKPTLGPDATALGQVFWYTLEGRDPDGRPAGGWDPQELRSIQDWQVRFALASAEGVAEVASVGGFVKEYQIDVDPDALRAYGVTLNEVAQAVRMSNLDVGARTIEINRVEYIVRGRGFLRHVEDIRQTVIKARDGAPVLIDHVADVSTGPALRRGALDKGGSEAVGGVAVVRYGGNPLKTIENIQNEIQRLAPGLPRRVVLRETAPEPETVSAFARREGVSASVGPHLDHDAWLAWLDTTARDRWPPWITTSQVTLVPFYDRTDLIHETLDTLSDALTQEILITVLVILLLLSHLGSATLISGLLPLAVLSCFIAMKQFGVDANIVALSGIAIAIGTMVDMGIVVCENILQHLKNRPEGQSRLEAVHAATSEVGTAVLTAVATTIISFLPVFTMSGPEGKLFKPLAFTKTYALIASVLVALLVIPPLAHILFRRTASERRSRWHWVLAGVVAWSLARAWEPLGPLHPVANLVFVALLVGGVLGGLSLFLRKYASLLRWCLDHKTAFLLIPLTVCLGGFKACSTLGREFMPPLDEGSFLLMPTTMPHASIGEALDVLSRQDERISSIPEVDNAVGKIGRVDSPLDPAPVSMIETLITLKPEYRVDDDGNRVRIWRDTIKSADDIWDEIVLAARIPGTTSAPKLQPIAARLVMLQSGMRAPMGVKIFGPDLESLETAALEVESLLKEVPAINPLTVIADRVVGKPYLEINIDRAAIARHGLHVRNIQEAIEVAVGGRPLTMTVEGRERYPVRLRYKRELRDTPEALGEILIPAPDGRRLPLGQLATIDYVRGPMVIKSEDTFKTAYVVFDKHPGAAEVDVVEMADAHLKANFSNPPGVHVKFSGTYENQVNAQQTLMVILPVALFAIFIILYLQFRSVITTFIIFSGIAIAWSGGFLLLWLYNQPWFLDVAVAGVPLRDLFQIGSINLSVAVWVGFLALFGIATDDGVILSTYLSQSLRDRRPATVDEIREVTVQAGLRRIRPCLMTSATTLLALVPILMSTGRGSDVMIPMAIPSFGGMLVVLMSVFAVPTLTCLVEERRLRS